MTLDLAPFMDFAARVTVPTLTRFVAKIEPEPNTGCWIWLGCIERYGYGRAWDGSRLWLAHRLAYVLARGPIPDDLTIDHLCRNRWCVNPAHLEPVTNAENIRRGDSGKAQRERTHCKHGHPLDGAAIVRSENRIKRMCITCHRDRARAAWRRKNWGTDASGR